MYTKIERQQYNKIYYAETKQRMEEDITFRNKRKLNNAKYQRKFKENAKERVN